MAFEARTGTKVIVGFVGAAVVAALVGGTALLSTRRLGASLDEVATRDLPGHRALGTLTAAKDAAMRHANALALPQATDRALRSAVAADLDAALSGIDAARRLYAATLHADEDRRPWDELQGPLVAYVDGIRALRDVQRERDVLLESEGMGDRLAAADARFRDAWLAIYREAEKVDERIAALVELNAKGVVARQEQSRALLSRSVATVSLAVVLGTCAMLTIGFVLSRMISRGIRAAAAEAQSLSDAIERGDLGRRGSPASVAPEFRPVIDGMNRTMDAFAAPLHMATTNIRRIANGDLPSRIETEYRGDFAVIRDSINAVLAVVQRRNADIEALTAAALAGQLSVRADTKAYEGYNGRMMDRINSLMDAVLAPVQEAREVLARLAARDLRARVSGAYRGDHAQLEAAVNATAEALQGTISRASTVAREVAAASEQIARSSEEVAGRTAQQASALQHTSSTLEAMASTTAQSAGSAAQANALAQRATGAAKQGAVAIADLGAAMTQIREATSSTAGIIREVNEIAFQTNLLALNAAVEAARAGDAGRSFAVVAEEVRALALRSKDAAQRTEALIEGSLRQVDSGETTSARAAEALGSIATLVEQVGAVVAEIAASAKAQAGGIAQVTEAVSHVDSVTQRNAASAEESSAAATELAKQAKELAAVVSSFRLDDDGEARPVVVSVRRARPAPARAATTR